MRESILPAIRAWCRHYGAPDPGEPDEEMRFRARPEFISWLDARIAATWRRSTSAQTWFNRDPLPVSRFHRWPGSAARTSLRESVPGWSLQVVLFLTLTGDVIGYQMDFDEENPLGGALKGAQHLFRLLKRWKFGGSTTLTSIERGLNQRGIPLSKETECTA